MLRYNILPLKTVEAFSLSVKARRTQCKQHISLGSLVLTIQTRWGEQRGVGGHLGWGGWAGVCMDVCLCMCVCILWTHRVLRGKTMGWQRFASFCPQLCGESQLFQYGYCGGQDAFWIQSCGGHQSVGKLLPFSSFEGGLMIIAFNYH